MQWSKILKQMIFLLGISVISAFTINFFSPAGIALVGQWDESLGVVTAKTNNDTFIDEFVIEDAENAKQIYDSDRAVFVDSRSHENYQDGHIKGAASLPVGQFDEIIEAFEEKYPTDTFIVAYCSGRTCNDSHKLAQLLLDYGYMSVSVFIDGYPGWKAKGYPIE
jgi:rhodanese-related sulfurtransferase